MPDKKEMHQAILIQVIGVLCIGIFPRIISGIIGNALGLIIGIGLIIFGAKKYREAKRK